MAKRRRKQRERQDETAIRFENLDGRPDDEYVDPLDSEPGESGEPGDAAETDPRAEDPFADDTLDESEDDRPEPRKADADRGDDREQEEDEEEDEDAAADDAGKDERDDGKATDGVDDADLRALLAETRQELEEVRRDRDLTRKQAAEANKNLYESRSKEVDEQLTRTRADLKRSIEDGDTDKQVELNERLAELHATKRELSSLKERADQQQETQQHEDRADSDEPPVVRAQTPAAERWMRGRNWINNPAYKQQNQDLVRMAGVLVEDGYDPQQSEYYQELERRMRRRHPDLFANGSAARPQRRPDRQTVSRVSRDDPPQRAAGNKVVITSEDRRTMQRFGLDPSNRDHLREFAKNKIA